MVLVFGTEYMQTMGFSRFSDSTEPKRTGGRVGKPTSSMDGQKLDLATQ